MPERWFFGFYLRVLVGQARCNDVTESRNLTTNMRIRKPYSAYKLNTIAVAPLEAEA